MMSYSKFKLAGCWIVALCGSLLLPVHLAIGQSSQPAVIQGKVSASLDGSPLAGATVSIRGTNQAGQTDDAGSFSIQAAIPATLVVSFTGYVTQTITVNDSKPLSVALVSDEEQLEEVVVVGYGTQRKRDLTGSIASVKGDDIRLPSAASFDQMLQGRVAGAQISQTTGAPGGNVNVQIRGVSSITGGNQPLYVVDGFAIGGSSQSSDMQSFGGSTFSSAGMANNTQQRINPLASINPADIESIEVLKDASATAIYGSRGANGVVIITTKRGALGKPEVSFDVSYGIQQIAHKLDMMNAQEFAEYTAEGRDAAWVYANPATNSASDPNEVRSSTTQVKPEFRHPESLIYNTDWQDAIYRTAPVQNYQLAIGGGTDKIRYRVSGGYFDQQGIILTSDYNRFNLRTNVEAQLSDWIKIGTNTAGSYAYGTFPNTEGHLGNRPIIGAAIASSPAIPIRDEAGNYFSEILDPLGVTVENPLFILDNFTDKRKLSDFLTNNYVEIKLLEPLTFKSSIGVKFATNEIRLWKSSKLGSYGSQTSPATAGVTKDESLNWLNENTLTFDQTFSNIHHLNAFAGFTVQKDTYDRLSAGATDFPTDYVPYLSAGTVNAGTHIISQWAMVSLIARANYSYDGRYLLTATVRRDGSSRFGQNNKWGTFPSFSVGYNISEESFMEPVRFVNNLKIRASYGLAGNNQIGNYAHIGLLTPSNYVDNGQLAPGLIPSNMPNYNLTWEKSKQVNLGLDVGFFQDRISLTADIYRDLKTALLLAVQLPAATGYGSSTQNIGEIENKGLELALSTENIKGDRFNWSSTLTFNRNVNKVLKVAVDGGRISNSAYQITQVGDPISSFYLMNVLGVFKNAEEVSSNPIQHPATQPGDLRFEDVDQNGRITASDKRIVGSPWPDFTWGFLNNFSYKNWSLNVFVNGSQGADTYFIAGETILGSNGVQNQLSMVNDRWRSESNPGSGLIPRAIRSNHAYGFSTSSRFLFDASYIRIKNVRLGYQLPGSLAVRLRTTGLNVFIDVTNLATFTDYPGYDPESNTAGDNIDNSGLDFMTYPLARTFTFGIGLKF